MGGDWVMMIRSEVQAALLQAQFFNQQWKNHQNIVGFENFAELMRVSKNRCQLQILRFASSDLVSMRFDHVESATVGEPLWLVGGIGMPEGLACHMPLRILQEQLSSDQLAIWQVGEF